MTFSLLILLGLGVAVFFFATQSLETKRSTVVEVLDFPDGTSVLLREGANTFSAILAGIGYPTDDPRSEMDACERLRDIAAGKRLKMIVHKKVGDLQYVELSAGDGESLNRMLVRYGMARLELKGIGSIPELFSAEVMARNEELGIWDRNRDAFKTMGVEEGEESSDFDPDAADIDHEGVSPSNRNVSQGVAASELKDLS